MCIMAVSSEGELELVGLMRRGLRFSYNLRYGRTGPRSFMAGGGEKHLLIRIC